MVKRKHQLLTESERDQILAIPTDRDHLARLYSFEPSDIDIIGARRERRNRLGVALQLALLRHPGTTLAQNDLPIGDVHRSHSLSCWLFGRIAAIG